MSDTDLNINAGAQTPLSSAPATRTRGRRWRRVGRWLARVALALCFLAGFYYSVVPSGRAAARALIVLPGVLTATQPAWQAPVVEPITHTQTTLPSASGTVFLDVYAPTGAVSPLPGSREGMLVITGVGDNRKEPQVVNFSQTLARAGIVVMDVTTPALLADRVDAGDRDAVVQAFRVLQHWPAVGATRVGMFGISAGGALICLTAADPRIRDQVAFVSLLGSYYDTTTLLETLGRRAQVVDGKLQPWNPVAVPLQALSSTIAPALPGNDGSVLVNAFASYPAGALTSGQLAQLAPESAAIYHLLAGDQPTRVAANLAALSPTLHALLANLSLSTVVNELHAPVYLLHDRNDQFVPVTESRAFAAALARLHHPYDFAEFGIFQHADVRAGLGLPQLLGDGQSLFRLISEVTQAGS
jgi:dienelactone hydrolase